MRRTRLFHSIVIVGSGLLASCEKGPTPVRKDAAVTKIKDAPPVVLIDAPPAPRIEAMDVVQPPPPRIMPAPPRIQVAPPHPRIQVRRPPRIVNP